MALTDVALCVQDTGALRPEEQALQALLQCDLTNRQKDPGFAFTLQCTASGLTLYSTAADAPGGLCLDLLSPGLRRRAQASLQKQDLGKALGLKPGYRPTVLDATAGLGTDAYLMASAGCRVEMLERHPVVYALLRDAMARASSSPVVQDVLSRMHLQHGDFTAFELAEGYDVVYLDPMFPKDRKTARSGKGMYLLQTLLGSSQGEESMLPKALALATRRVVVKRGKLSPGLTSQQPDISFRGSSSRYDVYLCGAARTDTA